MSFKSQIKQNRTFILGAGFSAHAGVPMIGELLHRTMTNFKRDCYGLYQRVDNYAHECFNFDQSLNIDYSSVSFSDLCTFLEYIELREYGGGERFSKDGSREKVSLRYYLSKTIIDSTPEGVCIPQLYLDFANELHNGDIVISFNWDPLLERSLNVAGKEYTYNGSNTNAIRLIKLHGSVNWRLGEPYDFQKSKINLHWESMGFTDGMMDQEIYHSSKLLEASYWHRPDCAAEIVPFLVLPGYGKAFDVRANAELWYKPEFMFAFTHDVYIIGLSLAPDDFFIRSFFLANLPFIESFSGVPGRQIHIINPASDICQNYNFIADKSFTVLHKEKFNSKHIKVMIENRLKP